jgi:hypothetical protein
MVGSALEQALLALTSETSWDKDIIVHAFTACQRDSYKVSQFLKKTYTAPSRRFKARLFVDLDIDLFKVSLIVSRARSQEEVWRTVVLQRIPQIHCILEYGSYCRWISDSQFEIVARSDARERYIITLPSNILESQ